MPPLSLDTPDSAPRLEDCAEHVQSESIGLQDLQLWARAILAYTGATPVQQKEQREAALLFTSAPMSETVALLQEPDRFSETAGVQSQSALQAAYGSIRSTLRAIFAAARDLAVDPGAPVSSPALTDSKTSRNAMRSAAKPVIPAPLTTGRWDSGRRSRQIAPTDLKSGSASAAAPGSSQHGSAVRQSDSGRRLLAGLQEDPVRSIPATAWIPREPAPSAPKPLSRPEPPALTRRWDLLSRFDSGSRPAVQTSATAAASESKDSVAGK